MDEATSEENPTILDDNQDTSLSITIHHHGEPHTFALPADSTLQDLSSAISTTLSIPPSNQKLLISPKPGMLKAPFPTTPLSALLPTPSTSSKTKITLYGSTTSEISSLNSTISSAQRPRQSRVKPATPSRHRNWQKQHDESTYTFHTLRPLPYLPNPARSTRFLTRLASDPGIRSAMLTHKFSVPLLTEMDPAEHTTLESRTLGLNRNKGEVIELRLRTDAYDGYRDYKVIRKTLCHELAHCVWGEHDRNFWDLTAQIEREVERADWKSGGHRVGDEEFYNPDDQGEEGYFDHGGWTGGEFVLGSSATNAAGAEAGLTRREILARAAEERARKAKGGSDAGGRDGGTEAETPGP